MDKWFLISVSRFLELRVEYQAQVALEEQQRAEAAARQRAQEALAARQAEERRYKSQVLYFNIIILSASPITCLSFLSCHMIFKKYLIYYGNVS